MDILQLTTFLAPLWPVILPFLLEGGREAWKGFAKVYGEKFGKESLELTEGFWKKLFLKIKGKPNTLEAVQDAINTPEDPRTKGALEWQLEKLLNENPDLRKEAEIVVGQIVNVTYQAGDNSVVAEEIKDSTVVTGKDNRYIRAETYIEHVHQGLPPRDPQEALHNYRRVLAQTTSNLPLRGRDLGASDPTAAQKPISLANVYVDLNTKTIREEHRKARKGEEQAGVFDEIGEPKALSALEALIQNRRLVLLGDPGSGKSTFANYLAHCLASQTLKQLNGWLDAEADILPIIVILRDFARGLPKNLPPRAEPCHLWDFIAGRLKAQNLTSTAKPIQQLLEKGKALLLFDGLDEVPTIPQRIFIRDAVNAFVECYPANRFLVTCRVLSYQPPKAKSEPDLRLASFPEFELAPFDPKQINQFIEAWYNELASLGIVASEEAHRLAQRLRTAIQRPELRRLAPNPLLLTVMALVNTHKSRLPDARALLYEDTIDVLLWRWEQVSKGQASLSKLMSTADCTDIDLKRVLQELAFQAHEQAKADNDEELAGISESSLEKAIAALNRGDRNWAAQVIETMKMRAGLLLERDVGVFTFPHRSFQEYLAGAYLTSREDFVARAVELAESGNIWREVVLWAVGCFVYLPGGNIHMPLALAAELCPSISPKDDRAWHKTWLAGDVLLEIGLNRVETAAIGRELLPRVRECLSNLLNEGRLTPRERAAAGDTLARLGDPRPGIKALDFLWCAVPAGKFLMGSRKDETDSSSAEHPQFTYETEKPYYIARYPVTNAQFEAFVDDPQGYKKKDWWTADGWEWRKAEKRERPGKFGGVFDLPNHPVVNVSWYESVAFTNWLNERLKAEGFKVQVWKEGKIEAVSLDQENNWEVRLPTEAEWEKAARGIEGSRYPWGNEPDPNRANYDETGIGTTSAVGCFPRGESPYGLMDMSGNVWEWCATQWLEDYKDYRKKEDNDPKGNAPRVLRGGAFNLNDWVVRCAYRLRYDPHDVWYRSGFRVAVGASPIPGS